MATKTSCIRTFFYETCMYIYKNTKLLQLSPFYTYQDWCGSRVGPTKFGTLSKILMMPLCSFLNLNGNLQTFTLKIK